MAGTPVVTPRRRAAPALAAAVAAAALCAPRAAAAAGGTVAAMPDGFVWGVSSAAYQYEGGWDADGKGESIWDVWSHTQGKVAGNDTGDVANDVYHRLDEHVALVKGLGVGAYRFSVSWPRLIPNGTGEPNPAGVAFYRRLLSLLRASGVEAYVTLYHWDLPQALQERHGGWLGPELPAAFGEYAATCFRLFGDSVARWVTVNEPWSVALGAYYQNSFAPGAAPYPNSTATAPYTAARHLLLAHSAAVAAHRHAFAAGGGGGIGMVLNTNWYQPANASSAADAAAAARALAFQFGWFMHPLATGDWPEEMRSAVGDRLPAFSAAESAALKGSYDFVGLNHYTTSTVTELPAGMHLPYPPGYAFDQRVLPLPASTWAPNVSATGLPIVPEGLRATLRWVKQQYGSPAVIVTENGVALDDGALPSPVDDAPRVQYLMGYTAAAAAAIESDGVDLRGYFAWSLSDNFEWSSGYAVRFGLVHVERARDADGALRPTRFDPKASYKWWARAAACNCVPGW